MGKGHRQELSGQVSPPLLLVGNPNVGKSVIFGTLTGRYVDVSNYPGTTVEVTRGKARALPGSPEVIDTPGTNSLTPQSEDEQVTRDILLRQGEAVVVQVGDTKNLRRVLYLTLQLGELARRQILVLNLQDEARDLGVHVDAEELSRELQVPVIPATATRGIGLDGIATSLDHAGVSALRPAYPTAVEDHAAAVASLLPENLGEAGRGIALMLLAGDRTLRAWADANLTPAARLRIDTLRAELDRSLGVPAATTIARARHRAVAQLLRAVYEADRAPRGSLRERLGTLAMHPFWGVPVLVLVLLTAYLLVAVVGAGMLVGLLEEGLFGKVINPAAQAVSERWIPWPWAKELLVGPYGLVTMALTYSIAIVLPVVGTFFVFFGLLEDAGYLPRLAVMLNRPFRTMGLNGKAVLPMVLGLGCDTMATLTTRILPTRKERVVVTLLLALGVPCSAQLGVLLALLASMSLLGTALWGVVVAGSLVGAGWAASRLVPGRVSDFILEVPPLRWPSFSNVAIKTVARTEWYLKEAVPLFVLGTLLLFLLDVSGGLALFQEISRPIVGGALGLPEQAADAFLLGFLRRDYGAAGLFVLRQQGQLDGVQTLVSLVVITLFVPCIANLLMMVKERGLAVTAAMVTFIVPFAVVVGAILNLVLRELGVVL
jgi:ferrous iron transport protein B